MNMRKWAAIIASAALAAVVFTGCGGQASTSASAASASAESATAASSAAAEPAASASAEAAPTTTTSATSAAATSAAASAPAASAPAASAAATSAPAASAAATSASATAAAGQITLDDAIAIALQDAGLTADQVTMTKQGSDTDDAVPHYEVEFVGPDSVEHDYDIDMSTGAIIAVDNELDDDGVAAQNAASGQAATADGYIGEDAATQIALDAAGVTAADTTGLTVHLETDDGVERYEVDFQVGTTEYNYDIDPTTGTILESDADAEND